MILVENLSHQYGSRLALSNVSFEVKAGEIFGLLGPNGGGKSTLFRILSTMMVPTGGRAEVAGHDVARDAAAVRRSIGVVFQTQSLDKALTVAREPAQPGPSARPLRRQAARTHGTGDRAPGHSPTAATIWWRRSPAA